MKGLSYTLLVVFWAALCGTSAVAQDSVAANPPEPRADATRIVQHEDEVSYVHLKPARRDDQPGLAVVFEGTDDLHYYARSETAPAPGLQLKVSAEADGIEFGEAIFPDWEPFRDALGQDVEVYVGDFVVFVPILTDSLADAQGSVDVTVKIAGIACTSMLCLPPFEQTLNTTIDLGQIDAWEPVALSDEEAVETGTAKGPAAEPDAGPEATRQAVLPYGTGVYYLLAIVAGISINIMPCVLPVLPLILMRLIDQSKQPGGSRIASGMAFCVGVILFFAAFALISAIVNITTGAVIDLNSLFRYPAAVIALFLGIVFFGLVMLDVITLTLPSSVTGAQGKASGVAGSLGMGFFAGILSTPCSGALLGFVLVWAQTQPLLVSSTAIVLMGVGMALPYAVIVLIPSLLNRVPKPGTWMEIFKKSTGFLLFFIAAKLMLAALPKDRLLNVLTYGIIFSFCVWMWGKWVGFSTPPAKRRAVRIAALVIAVATGLWLLPAHGQGEQLIDWEPYDASLVQAAVANDQPVLIKFTADWCTNCKVVESRVYGDPEVAGLIEEKDVLPIKADTTLNDYPATEDLKQVYGEAGNVPVSIVLLPDGTREKLRGIFEREELTRILASLSEGTE